MIQKATVMFVVLWSIMVGNWANFINGGKRIEFQISSRTEHFPIGSTPYREHAFSYRDL